MLFTVSQSSYERLPWASRYKIARDAVEEIEHDWAVLIGTKKMRQLRELLTELNNALSNAASSAR